MNDDEKDGRVGIYYYENGAYPRKPRIVYDRAHTSMSRLSADEFPASMYSLTRCFHTTGITLALSNSIKATAFEMIKRFKENGALISFDVIFGAISGQEKKRGNRLRRYFPLSTSFFCSEDTARLTFKKSGDVKKNDERVCRGV